MGFWTKKQPSQNDIKKRLLLQSLILKDLEKVWTEYVSNSKPQYVEKNEEGLEIRREPKRNELIDAIIVQVSLEGIIKVHPELKKKLEELEQ